MSCRLRATSFLFLTAFANVAFSAGFMIKLENGMFYGPGNLGQQKIQDGYLENFTVTAPMTGHVPFFNNGPDAPNVFGESSHTGPVDGLLSDGTKINENVNAAFVLDVMEPETQELVKLFVGSVSRETVALDENENLTFNLTAAFDSGFAQDVMQLPIQFITGTVEVPVSEKNKLSLPGGHDSAGPYPAGSLISGRFGDMDQDGYLDGTFVLAGNTPIELLIAEGDPVLLIRPFTSDIPLNAKEAAYFELTGMINNLLIPPIDYLSQQKVNLATLYIEDINERLDIIIENINRIKIKKSDSENLHDLKLIHKGQLLESRKKLNEIINDLSGKQTDILIKKLNKVFDNLKESHANISNLLNKNN